MSEDMQQTCKHLGGAVHAAALGKTAALMESTTTIKLRKKPDSRQRTERKGANVLISLMARASNVGGPTISLKGEKMPTFDALMKLHPVAADAYTATLDQNRGVAFSDKQVQKMARFVQHFVAIDNDTANLVNPDAATAVDITVFIHMAHDAQLPATKQEATTADDEEDFSDLDLDDEDDEDYSDLDDVPTATAEVPVTTPDGLTSVQDAASYIAANGGKVAVLEAFAARLKASGHILSGTRNGIRPKPMTDKHLRVKDVRSTKGGSVMQTTKSAAFCMVDVAPRRGQGNGAMWAADVVFKDEHLTSRQVRDTATWNLVVLTAAVVEMHDHDIVKGGDPRQYLDDSWRDHGYLDQDVVTSPPGGNSSAKMWQIDPYARGNRTGQTGVIDVDAMDVSDLLGF